MRQQWWGREGRGSMNKNSSKNRCWKLFTQSYYTAVNALNDHVRIHAYYLTNSSRTRSFRRHDVNHDFSGINLTHFQRFIFGAVSNKNLKSFANQFSRFLHNYRKLVIQGHGYRTRLIKENHRLNKELTSDNQTQTHVYLL